MGILSAELIGLRVRVEESTDPTKEWVAGEVVDETRNTLVIETRGGDRTVPKAECKFAFRYEGEWVGVDGELLVGRPEDRIKKGRRFGGRWRLPKFFFR